MNDLCKILTATFLLMFVVACNEPQEQENTTTETTEHVHTEVEQVGEEMIDPEEFEPMTFGYFGLYGMNMGDEMQFLELPEEIIVMDTTIQEQGITEDGSAAEYVWSGKRVNFEDGFVLFEADFDENKYLNRVRIETSEYRHFRNGLGVGSTLADVLNVYPQAAINPFPQFGVTEIIPNDHNIYHIEGMGDMNVEDPGTWKAESLDPEAKVVRVVLM